MAAIEEEEMGSSWRLRGVTELLLRGLLLCALAAGEEKSPTAWSGLAQKDLWEGRKWVGSWVGAGEVKGCPLNGAHSFLEVRALV